MSKEYYYIGIDNGVSGSIAVVDSRGRLLLYAPTPVEMRQDYPKAKDMGNRVIPHALREMLAPYAENSTTVVERPVTNPMSGWKSIKSTLYCHEATRVIMEELGMRYQYVSSGDWQRPMLPNLKSVPRAKAGLSKEEKKAHKARITDVKKQTKVQSLETGRRLFPGQKFKIDADAALMAEWARKEKL